MSPNRISSWLRKDRAVLMLIAFGLRFVLGCVHGETVPVPVSLGVDDEKGPVLTSFEDIWNLPQVQQQDWHRIQFDFTVYYYDPLWKVLWGLCRETNNFISLGAKPFPIKVGQRVRITGKILPSRGMEVEQPGIAVLEESVPLEYLSTAGDVGNTARFDRRLVAMEGYVDRQMLRDGNHLELQMISEGVPLQVGITLPLGAMVPQLRESVIQIKGVYFYRADGTTAAPRIEVFVQGPEHVKVIGSLAADSQFDAPLFDSTRLTPQGSQARVRVRGKAGARQVGEPLRIKTDTADVIVETSETLELKVGEEVEAIGVGTRVGDALVLRQGLYRRAQRVYTRISDLWNMPEVEREKTYPVRIEYIVYYYDPLWNSMWGREGDHDEYLAPGTRPFPIKAGQKVLVEGRICPAKGPSVEVTRVTVLEESVATPAIPVAGRITETNFFNRKIAIVEGVVDRQSLIDKNHLLLETVVEGRMVMGRVLLPDGAEIPSWEGALVRMTGVFSVTTDPTGGLPTIELWMQGKDRVEIVGSLEKDPRFNIAVTAIEKLGEAPPNQRVRVEGAARAQQPGKSLTIRDDTGQVTLATAQGRAAAFGERLEAIGFPVLEGNEWTLREALFRHSHSLPPPPPTGLPKLRLADQLRELAPEEAARGYPVQLSGVVIWARPNADFIYIRDASGGVCVYRPPSYTNVIYLGTKVEITGVSAPGKFTPVVMASHLQTFSTVELPEPRRVTLEQALTGVEEAEWVSMSGYVRAVEPEGVWTRFEMTTSGGEFQAILAPNPRWDTIVGCVVRIKGVCTARTNGKRQLTGIQVWVPTSRFVDIEEAVPQNPFEVTRRPIASLRQFGSLEALNRRVGVTGTVIHQEPGLLVNIQEGSEGLLVLSRDTTSLVPGDRIEAVGFPGRENSRLVLREAVFRKVASGTEPVPVQLDRIVPIDAERDGVLARVEGTLVDIGAQERGTRLMLENGGIFFEAMFNRPKSALPDTWIPGSRLELTGVHEIEFDEYRRPHGVRLQLRSVADVRVLKRPSILTVRRVLAVTGVLAVCVVLGVGWVLALRRRVRNQTGVIREQLESEKAARLDAALARASKLESVGVLAGGIAHDFNNLLTVVIGNLSLAKLDEKIETETVRFINESEKAAARARDLTQQLLTFAKGGEPVRTSARLPEIVQEATEFGLHGSKVRSEFDIAADIWPAEVDKGQIAQVVHNLIINASQAMPAGGLIQISMRNEEFAADARPGLAAGRYVRLTISDTGAGIPAENLSRIFEPYFTTKAQGSGLGLATVYSIVKKHDGQIDVHSKEGEGTTFSLWLPAAGEAPVVTCAAPECAAAKAGRVLIMDDELAIRRLGSAVIKRMGLEVTAVDDGAAVVSEYAAARAAGRPYDLVILDLTVPGGMGGAEAMERLREMNSDVRAIVSSGYSSDPVMANHLTYGFKGRVPKPYTATDLIDAVKTVLKPEAETV